MAPSSTSATPSSGGVTDPAEVDPASVPQRTLRDGSSMPGIGMGTFGSDRYGPSEVSAAVRGALRAGYRLVDCASVYGNEDSIGEVLAEAQQDGLRRDEVFVMSKVWNDSHAPADAVASVEKSLADLQLDHLDAVFVHWPFPNHHPPHASTDARDPHARPYAHEAYMETWGALEGLVERGLVRHLGSSNTTVPKLSMLLRDARVAPSLNEMELHPTFQQGQLFQFCLDHGVQPVGYSPLGSPSRPERDRAPDDVTDTEHPAVQAAAARLGIHPALVCLKWAVARGQIPIPFSVKPAQYTANLRAVVEDPLLPAELEALRSVERNSRLIKGQVFLWEGASSWLDLWDVDGTIPGWEGYEAERPAEAKRPPEALLHP